MGSAIVTQCIAALRQNEWTIAFAESASAGKMCYAFATIPDSGAVVLGGMVCYHPCMKEDALGISAELIAEHTAESAEVTRAMAENFRRRTPADVVVAITGLTTPGGSETPQKPVGTIFLHVLTPAQSIAERYVFDGTPDEIVDQATDAAALLVLKAIGH